MVLLPITLDCSKFVDSSSISNCSLRDTEGKLAIPQLHTNSMKNNFTTILEQFFGIVYQLNCGRLTPLKRSGLAASVSFHQVKFTIFTHDTHITHSRFYFVI